VDQLELDHRGDDVVVRPAEQLLVLSEQPEQHDVGRLAGGPL